MTRANNHCEGIVRRKHAPQALGALRTSFPTQRSQGRSAGETLAALGGGGQRIAGPFQADQCGLFDRVYASVHARLFVRRAPSVARLGGVHVG